MNELLALLARVGYLPHGLCFSWDPALLWTMVGADTVIALSYFSIPLAIGQFVRQRDQQLGQPMPYRWVALLFAAFIFACGLTHLMDIWVIWQPDYAWQAVALVMAAVVSLATAVALWLLLPRALTIPTVSQLQRAIGGLEAEAARRRHAELHADEVEQGLALALASFDAGFISADREGHVTHMNAVAERVTGWSRAQARGRAVGQVLVQDGASDDERHRNPVEALIDQRRAVDDTRQLTVVALDGQRTRLQLKAQLTRDADDQVRGLVMVFSDVSRLDQAEAASRRLAAIVESSSDAIIGKTLEGRITSWNRAAEGMFGYSPQQAIGQSVLMLIPPDRRDEEMRILADVSRGLVVPAFDTVRRARDGRMIDVSVTISPIRDGEGRIVGGSKIARDITRQRQNEAALSDSQSRLRFALEAAQIGDWDLDLDSGQSIRSLRHDRCFGYDSLQPTWDLEAFLRHVHTDDRAWVGSMANAALQSQGSWAAECRVVWPDGGVHWISAHGTVHVEAGRARRMLGIVTDITTQKRAEQARLRAERLEAENRQIQEASRLKSQFLANMSHELRTPLNAIIGFADLLQLGTVPPESPRHGVFLGHIVTSGRHLLQLINDVLDLSKVESGKFEFFPEPVDLARLASEVGNVLHTQLQRKSIDFSIDVEPTLGPVTVDPSRLKQVLYNLLSNAIKFTPAFGQVMLRARAESPERFCIEVEDTGIGIAEADLPRLFVEFQQLDAGPDKRHQGTGLGLALSRRLVHAQGGSIGVRSTLGAGSVFHVVLWRQPVAAGASLLLPRVLVIEPDMPWQARMAEALGQFGIGFDLAGSGEQARAQARHRPYDAILLDLHLPDQAGLEALEDIRRDGPNQRASVVSMMMSHVPGGVVGFAIADLLGKPLRGGELRAAMARCLLPRAGATRVLVIDDNAQARELMTAELALIGLDAVAVADGREALRNLERLRPDAIVLDLVMPEFDGFAMLDALQRQPAWRDTPVFVWTSMALTRAEYDSLARSALAVRQQGGGDANQVVDRLRHWRPGIVAAGDGS